MESSGLRQQIFLSKCKSNSREETCKSMRRNAIFYPIKPGGKRYSPILLNRMEFFIPTPLLSSFEPGSVTVTLTGKTSNNISSSL